MPGNNCDVRGCGSNSLKDKSISFFRFPLTDELRCKDWCQRLGLDFSGTASLTNKRDCHTHFHESQYRISRIPNVDSVPNQRAPIESARTPPSAYQTENVTPRRPLTSNNNQENQGIATKLSEKSLQIKRLRATECNLNRKILKLTEEIENEDRILDSGAIKRLFAPSNSMQQFMEMQIKRYHLKITVPYTDMEKALTLTIYYSCGAKGYRTLRDLGFKLPSASTIRRWICKLNLTPGRNQDILDCLAEKVVNMNEFERNAVLSLDETYISKLLSYDKFADRIEGFQDFGENKREMKIADSALVLIVRGLTTACKMPLAYYYSCKSTKSTDLHFIVSQCIKDLQSIGLKIRVVVTDQGCTNQGMFGLFGVTVEEPHVTINGQKIYFIYDAPNIMKNIRTNMKRSYGYERDEANYHIQWSHIRDFYEYDKGNTLRTAPKLTNDHIDPSSFQLMKVRLAVQVLSQSVASGMSVMIEDGILKPEYRETVDFIQNMNDIFDVLNISEERVQGKPLKSGRYVFNNLNIFDDLVNWIVTIHKIQDGGRRLPCLVALEITLRGVGWLLHDLKEENVGWVMTRRLQSDIMEHFFAFIKHSVGGNHKPNATQFRRAFRYQFITNLMRTPEGSNCQQFDEGENIEETLYKIRFLINKNKPSTTCIASADDSDSEDEYESDGEGYDSNDDDRTAYVTNSYFEDLSHLLPNMTSENAAVYMGGWAVKKINAKTKCANCPMLIEKMNDRPTPSLNPNEKLSLFKAYKKDTFVRGLKGSFGELLKDSSKPAFIRLGEIIANKSFLAFNLIATNVVKNLYRIMFKDAIISSFVNDTNNHDECLKHRKEMIKLIIRARLYLIVQDENDKIRDSAKSQKSIKFTKIVTATDHSDDNLA